jgi:hypothetical protein
VEKKEAGAWERPGAKNFGEERTAVLFLPEMTRQKVAFLPHRAAGGFLGFVGEVRFLTPRIGAPFDPQ